MGQLHDFGIVKTNVQIQEKHQKEKEKEESNYRAHSYCRARLSCPVSAGSRRHDDLAV